jgi:hypothetical protein
MGLLSPAHGGRTEGAFGPLARGAPGGFGRGPFVGFRPEAVCWVSARGGLLRFGRRPRRGRDERTGTAGTLRERSNPARRRPPASAPGHARSAPAPWGRGWENHEPWDIVTDSHDRLLTQAGYG